MFGRRRFLAGGGGVLLSLVGCDRKAPASTLKPGDTLPEATWPALDGRPFSIQSTGGPLLLNFWATWCPPCRAEMAALARLYRDFAGRGLSVLGVSVDSDVYLVQEYLLKARISLPVLLDKGGETAGRRFLVRAYPTSYLVERSGLIAEVWIGEKDWDSDDMRQRIARVL